MKKQQRKRTRWKGLLICLAYLVPGLSVAQSPCEPVAQIVSAQGEIHVNEVAIDNATASLNRQTICIGDVIKAKDLSRAAIAIIGTDTLIRIDQNTELRLQDSPANKASFLELIKGAIKVLSPTPQSLGVQTPFVNATIEGTEFHLRVDDNKAIVSVLEGRVRASNEKGEVSLVAAQSAVAVAGAAPQLDVTIVPENAAQWTLFYAPVLESTELTPQLSASDPALYIRKAAQALSVGAVEEAKAAIDEALKLDSVSEDAWALNLVIAITRNDQAAIVQAIDQSKRLKTPSALIALSYAQQSQFDLNGALDSLRKAVAADAGNQLARARLAELWFSLGEIDRAEQEAQVAARPPGNARAMTILGFVSLAKIDVDSAVEHFRAAISMSSEDPLPHLGLGLARIRAGDLEDGIIEIKSAYGVNPSALVRSYLGKAYYEQRQAPEDEKQYAMAKQLDPNDPTPWLYDAIRQQASNQPVQALRDLQMSIELNDNRAVYRSRLLLDEDLAVRSTAIGQTFNNLGFEQLALLKGYESVRIEPSNHSGHRLLADSYQSLPRHEIARVNELFRSQLLQPININPVPARLGQANLFLNRIAGPSGVSFNEFAPAFNRNETRVQFSGVGGGNDTFGNDLTIAGVLNRFSYSLGQYHFETDGFRDNNDSEQDVLNAFVQFAATVKTSVLAEIRSTEDEQGDLELLFDPLNFDGSLRQKTDTDSARVGLRHDLGERSTLLASLLYEEAEITTNFDPDIEIFDDIEGTTAELQHIFVGDGWNLTSGVRSFNLDDDETATLPVFLPFPPFLDLETTMQSFESEELTAYLYSNLSPFQQLQVTLGVSATSSNGRAFDEDQINPKFGMIWQPTSTTAVRLAAFRTLQVNYISESNIQPFLEPTEVAGFNQFFTGIEGEDVWRYGLAIDQRIGDRIWTGVEYSRRDIETPIIFLGPPDQVFTFDTKEDSGRFYFYWTPLADADLSLRAEYQYDEKDTGDNPGPDDSTRIRTHRVPLNISYFAENGFSTSLTGTYIDQKGSFIEFLPFPPFVDASTQRDNSWVFDASISYRLPKRYGVLTLIANNVTDENYRFQDVDPANPRLVPERLVLLRFTLDFAL